MPASPRRSAARLVAMVLLVVLVGGCAFRIEESTVQPMTAEELAWLKAVTKLHEKINKVLTAPGNVYLTRAKMRSYVNTMRSCGRELARIGSPSDRLQPVYVIVKKACRTFDKGAKCFATAASLTTADGVIAGTREERIQQRAIECGVEAQGNGSNLLADAEAKGEEIKIFKAKAG
jgi:hypothetical protein